MSASKERSAPLSDRERDVLFLAADGLTDKEIAQRLGIGAKTVRTYWDRVRSKLGASSRTQALAMALRSAYDELAEREARFRTFIERLPAIFVAIDEDGQVVYVNEETTRLLGGSETAITDSHELLARLYPDPELRERVRQRWLRNREEFDGSELTVTNAEGEERTVAWYGHADETVPTPGSYWAIGVDVTEKAHAEAKDRMDAVALQAVVAEADQGMWLLDPQFRTRHVNVPMARLLLTTVENLADKNPLDFVAPEDQEAAVTLVKAGGGSRIPFRFMRCDGTFIPVRKSLLPIHGANGIEGYLIIASERVDK
ncbi:MAG: PAS domain S-box protein [Fimbriimonas sp.]